MAINLNSIINSVFPTGPSTGSSSFIFPSDLITGDRNFYTDIQFVKYEKRSVFEAPFLSPIGGVTLPLPKRINDVQTVVWEPVEGSTVASAIESAKAGEQLTDFGRVLEGVGGAGITAGYNLAKAAGLSNQIGVVGAYAGGYAPNPFLTMLFKSGAFKEHTLQWSFTPNNEQESNDLVQIINYFKMNMLPSYLFGGAGVSILNYPNLAQIQLYPNDDFTFRFKPCAVVGVSVDYSGAGVPSFFRNGAPTVINMAVSLKEIELWSQEDYENGMGVGTNSVGGLISNLINGAFK